MKLQNSTTNKSAVLCHVNSYQQLAVEQGKHKSLDPKLVISLVQSFCYNFCKMFTLTQLLNCLIVVLNCCEKSGSSVRI